MSKLIEFNAGNFVDKSLYDIENIKIGSLNKVELYNEIQMLLTGTLFDELGPGSKEHRIVFERACYELGISYHNFTKIELAKEIILFCSKILSDEWESLCFSTGDTVTTIGLKHVYMSLWCNKNASMNDSLVIVPYLNENNVYELSTSIIEDNLEENIDLFSDIISLLKEINSLWNDLYWHDDLFETDDFNQIIYDLFAQIYSSNTNDKDKFFNELTGILEINSTVMSREIAGKILSIISDIKDALVNLDELVEIEDVKKITTKIIMESSDKFTPLTKGQVSADVATWRIDYFIDKLNNGKLNLDPSFQRKDVWNIIDAQKLIISILRGVPLPSIIMQEDSDNIVTIVDGKQRLTSIFRFLGVHPMALIFVNDTINSLNDVSDLDKKSLKHLYKNNYREFKKTLKEKHKKDFSAKDEFDNYLPFRLPKNADDEIGYKDEIISLGDKYYTDLVNNDKPIYSRFAGKRYDILFNDVFRNASEAFIIPIIRFNKETSSNQIQEVFTMYNKQGKKLNADEIRNASYHNLRLANILMVSTGEKIFDEEDQIHKKYTKYLDKLNKIEESFEDYFKIPLNRFGRSKVLSNVISFLFDTDNIKISMSTTNRINSLYEDVKNNKFLSLPNNYENLIDLFYYSTQLHQKIGEHWHSDFKNSKKKQDKWEDLQTTATILGIIKALNHGNDNEDLSTLYKNNYDSLSENVIIQKVSTSILSKTQNCSNNDWQRPQKSQSKNQNEYIDNLSNLLASEFILFLDKEPSSVPINNNLNRLKK